MKYKLGDEVYLKGVITSINSCVHCLVAAHLLYGVGENE